MYFTRHKLQLEGRRNWEFMQMLATSHDGPTAAKHLIKSGANRITIILSARLLPCHTLHTPHSRAAQLATCAAIWLFVICHSRAALLSGFNRHTHTHAHKRKQTVDSDELVATSKGNSFKLSEDFTDLMSDLVRLLSVANEAVSAAFVVGLKRRAAVSSFLYPTLPTLPTLASFRSHERARARECELRLKSMQQAAVRLLNRLLATRP